MFGFYVEGRYELGSDVRVEIGLVDWFLYYLIARVHVGYCDCVAHFFGKWTSWIEECATIMQNGVETFVSALPFSAFSVSIENFM